MPPRHRHQSLSASLHRRGGGEDHHYDHDGGHINKRKAKLGRQYAFFTSCKSSTIIGGASAIIIFLLLSYLVVVKQSQSPLLVLGSREDKKETSEGADDFMEQVPFLRPLRRDEGSTSCQHLPSIYWINLDVSKERRNSLVKSMESSGIVDQHRVAAYDTKQTTALINSKQLMFHPQIQVYAGNGDPSFWKHPDNIYTYNEAACLMSHLKAIKQAYDDGREVALIVEDDALLSSLFCDEFDDYVAQAPEGWKVLQFATNNAHVIKFGYMIHEPFISWQRYHHSTRAYLINRAGMETLLGKVHSTNLIGGSVWSIQEFPSVVSDEAIYTFIGDTYYSTGLWIDTSDLDSTIQKREKKGNDPYSFLEGKEGQQIAMKRQDPPAHLFGRSLLVVMNVCISNESQILREIEVITQDTHAVCKFHRVCEWEINVVAVEASLATLFEEAASGMPSYAHLHMKVHSEAFNKFTFVGDVLGKLANYDLLLFKDNDQRINGFPWRSFVEHTDNAVLSAPLRSTQRDHMIWSTLKEKSQDVQFHDVHNWLPWWNGKSWDSRLVDKFQSIEPVEVPFLETYFVLVDAMFAKHFFERAFTSGLLDDSSLDYLLCKAAFDWDSKRPSCTLIPLVSTHEDSLNIMKRDAFIANESRENSIQIQSSRKDLDPSFEKWMLIVKEWLAIVGKQHTILEMEQLCLKRMNIGQLRKTDISGCAKKFIEEYLLTMAGPNGLRSEDVEPSAGREKE
ncbi:hypothetical protein QTG54_012860 [Skeletonema marinoi]|uniref:Glycosyl transferase family 25 domain-containing protein n=1 Tax=Skeletonema marinoi TaxID=267567 RepID=A0AAD9D818_9STRA|nr:hypothetical protein QTG54_012860 [Skeletonema marinoi]